MLHHMRPLCIVSILAAPVLAQSPDAGLAAFRQACLDATTDGVALNIAAHPDDEAGSTMVVLRRKYGLRTVNMYSTYGDGGQNAIGREIGPELAAIRVRETLAAAEKYGNDVRWLGFEDFGFSKTMEETLEFWGREVLLERMRRQITDIEPDIVITNHTQTGGHGHHRSSAFALETVLNERAEATGQVVALFQPGGGGRRGGRGQRNARGGRGVAQATARGNRGGGGQVRGRGRRGGSTAEAQAERPPETIAVLTLDSSELDAFLGTTYARQAREGLSEHRSQGMGGNYNPISRGRGRSWRLAFPAPPPPESGTRTVEVDLFEYVGSVLKEEAFQRTWASMGQDLNVLARELDSFREDRSVAEHVGRARRLLPTLRDAASALPRNEAGARAGRRLARRIDALERVVLAGSGVSVEAIVGRGPVPYGGEGEILVAVQAVGGVTPDRVTVTQGERVGTPAVPNSDRMFRVPFISEPPAGDAMMDGLAREPSFVTVDVYLELENLPFVVSRTLAYEPVPMIQMKWDRDLSMVPSGSEVERIFSMGVVYQGDDALQEQVQFEVPAGVQAEAIPPRVDLSPERPEVAVLVRVRVSEEADLNPKIVYARIGESESSLTLQPVAVEISPELKVGLVLGPDDTLQRSFEDLGIPHQVLDVSRMALTDLSQFSTLVLDFRAYPTQPGL
ncbi:MAG: PIG-L family deacetylase, partial [Longimicrobiales bacterium]